MDSDISRRAARTAAATLAVSLAVVAMLLMWQRQRELTHASERFEALCERAVATVRQRLASYEFGLRGLRGAVLVGGGAGATREQVRVYSATRNLEQEFPGARGFGVILRVPAAQEHAFVERARRDGYPSFAIRRLMPHAGELNVITFVEPQAQNEEAIGLDIASDPSRREAAFHSVRNGQATLTAPITLMQASAAERRGFLLLLPIYRPDMLIQTSQQREEAAIGWVYAPLVMDDVLNGLNFADGQATLTLRDGSEQKGTAFYTAGTPAPIGVADHFVREVPFEIFGRRWTAQLRATPAFFDASPIRSPWASSAVGIALSIALSGSAWFAVQAHGRNRRIRLEKARRAAIVEGSDDAIIAESIEGVVTEWNEGAERLFGYSAQEALGRPFARLLLPVGREAEDAELRARMARGERVQPMETTRLRRDGTLIDVSVSAAPIIDGDGRCVGMAKTLRDIREVIATRHALSKANAGLEEQVNERTDRLNETLRNLSKASALQTALFDAMTQAALIGVDPDGRINSFNRGAQLLLGYAAAEVVGHMRASDFNDPNELTERSRTLSEQLGQWVDPEHVITHVSTLATPTEWTYRRKDESRVPVSLTVTAMGDGSNAVNGFLIVAQDTRAQRQHEASLRQAIAQANDANAAKSRFLANMSHEIRTPINAVLGLTYLLEKTVLDAEQHTYVEKIKTAGTALLAQINDVLDLSKIEASQMHIERTAFSPRELMEQLSALFSHQAEAAAIDLRVHVDDDVPSGLEGDATRLRQVLANLLSNALKFTEAGYVDVDVRTVGPATAAHTRLRFIVRDTGIGISAENMARLFMPFAQADESTTRRFGGTGLGLSIVKQLVHLMDGEIDVSSTVGQGSVFTVELPFVVCETAPEGARKSHDPHADTPVDLTGIRVLLVDDSPINLDVACRILEKKGATVVVAADGREAVEHLKTNPEGIDIVLMDVQMPVMDGHQATREIRHTLRLQNLPIVALTAGITTGERERAEQAGMNDLVGKPFDPPALAACIVRHVQKARGLVRPARPSPTASATPSDDEHDAPGSPMDWPRIEGIDTDLVRARLVHSLPLFIKSLTRLFDDFSDFRSPQRVATACDELATLARQLHSFKSTAGSLGATTLEDLARRAEAACKDGDVQATKAWMRRLCIDFERLYERSMEHLAQNARP